MRKFVQARADKKHCILWALPLMEKMSGTSVKIIYIFKMNGDIGMETIVETSDDAQ